MILAIVNLFYSAKFLGNSHFLICKLVGIHLSHKIMVVSCFWWWDWNDLSRMQTWVIAYWHSALSSWDDPPPPLNCTNKFQKIRWHYIWDRLGCRSCCKFVSVDTQIFWIYFNSLFWCKLKTGMVLITILLQFVLI